MDAVGGLVIRDGHDVGSLALDTRRRLSGSLIDTLAQLHAIDPAATSLADLGRRDAYLEQQLRRLHRQYGSSAGRSLPLVDLSDLSIYVAFGFWKLAIILEGVHTRYRSGAYFDGDEAYERLGGEVPRLLERSFETLAAR